MFSLTHSLTHSPTLPSSLMIYKYIYIYIILSLKIFASGHFSFKISTSEQLHREIFPLQFLLALHFSIEIPFSATLSYLSLLAAILTAL